MRTKEIEKLRKLYVKGTKIELISMNNEPYPVKSGTIGIVQHVDDIGQIHVHWENGSSLALVIGVDSFKIIRPKSYGYKFIDFLSNRNVIKITNEEEFVRFYNFLEKLNLLDILKNNTKFQNWQKLALINNRNIHCFLFEYDNTRGLTWGDDIQKSINWYGIEPLTVEDLEII